MNDQNIQTITPATLDADLARIILEDTEGDNPKLSGSIFNGVALTVCVLALIGFEIRDDYRSSKETP